MRALFIQNFFPYPNVPPPGGYEMWCQEVCDGLLSRGHSVLVQTSSYCPGVAPAGDWPHVVRELELELAMKTGAAWRQFLWGRRRRERRNLDRFSRLLSQFDPDVVLIWAMFNLPISLAVLAEARRPVVYYVGDLWPLEPSPIHRYLQVPSRNAGRKLLKQALARLAPLWLPAPVLPVHVLQMQRVLCPSLFIRDRLRSAGVPEGNLAVVSGAIVTARYKSPMLDAKPERRGRDLQMLWVGRVAPGKGVETAIRGIGHLCRSSGLDIDLTVVGPGAEHYLRDLQALAVAEGVDSRIVFTGPVGQDDLPGMYGRFDVFVFTSELEESFGRVLVEAMAAGLPVVSTVGASATREILGDGKYGLTFQPGDAQALAGQLLRLATDNELRLRLAREGRAWARSKFDISGMVDGIENALQRAALSAVPGESA